MLLPHCRSLRNAQPDTRPSEFLLDQPPASTNPRATLDATGQRMNNLLYSGSDPHRGESGSDTRSRLRLGNPDPGEKCVSRSAQDLVDHAGQPITAETMSACLEQYRAGKPVLPYISSFPHWKGTRHTEDEVIIDLVEAGSVSLSQSLASALF